jgi:hypothetical protein
MRTKQIKSSMIQCQGNIKENKPTLPGEPVPSGILYLPFRLQLAAVLPELRGCGSVEAFEISGNAKHSQ